MSGYGGRHSEIGFTYRKNAPCARAKTHTHTRIPVHSRVILKAWVWEGSILFNMSTDISSVRVSP